MDDSTASGGPPREPALAQQSASVMTAVAQHGYGSSDVLRVVQLPRPEIAPGEVLIEVRAAAIDRGTWHLMQGTPRVVRLVVGLHTPRQPIIGRDVAGTVVQVGAEVTRFGPGDEVFGVAPGSVSQYTVAAESKLARRPVNLTWEQAAIVPISGGTAVQAVFDVGRVAAGQKVLVTGASGGVGSFAVQLATSAGAEVTGVASAAKHDLVRSLGAHRVVDYADRDFVERGAPYDLIIDIAGLPALARLRRALTPRGTVVLVGGEGGGDLTGGTIGRHLTGRLTSVFSQQRLVGLIAKERGSDFERITALVESGRVLPTLDRSYPLTEAADAMRRLESGSVRGKIAITIAAPPG